MQTYTVDILNEKAVKLLQDLEMLELIRLRKKVDETMRKDRLLARFKGINGLKIMNPFEIT